VHINDSDIPGEIALFLFMASKNGSVKIAITSVKRVKNSFSLSFGFADHGTLLGWVRKRLCSEFDGVELC
jgi:hypothetical protein